MISLPWNEKRVLLIQPYKLRNVSDQFFLLIFILGQLPSRFFLFSTSDVNMRTKSFVTMIKYRRHSITLPGTNFTN